MLVPRADSLKVRTQKFLRIAKATTVIFAPLFYSPPAIVGWLEQKTQYTWHIFYDLFLSGRYALQEKTIKKSLSVVELR